MKASANGRGRGSARPLCQDDIFDQIEAAVAPILESNAKRFFNQLGMTRDAARNEARYGLLVALRNYDYNDSKGGIYNFASTSLRLHFLALLRKSRRAKRVPHVVDTGKGGRLVLRMALLGDEPSTDSSGGGVLESLSDPAHAPDTRRVWQDSEIAARTLHAALMGVLGPREIDVLACRMDPPRALRMIMFEECQERPTMPVVCRYLGLSRNQADWALRKIRHETVRLIREGDFSGMEAHDLVRSYEETHSL